MFEIISVVIPVFNTAPYLKKCLDSVCGQTYQNLEIICVDDGSTDGSEKIVEDYARKDPRVKVLHKSNGGESSARNAGLQESTGEYVAFVDCDDWLEPDMYENMVQAMEEKSVDMVLCGYFLSTDAGSSPVKNEKPVSEDVFDRHKLFGYVYQRDSYRGVTSWIWCKLFRRKLLFCNGEMISFDETLRFGGDLLFFIRAALNVSRTVYLPQPFYHYYQRESSTAHSLDDLDLAFEIVETYQRMIDFLERQQAELDSIIWLKRFKVYWATRIAETAHRQKDKKGLQKAQRFMCEYEREYLDTNQEYADRLERFQKLKELSV